MERQNKVRQAMSFLPMVDAVLCAVAIVLILILVQRSQVSKIGEIPQADIALRCITTGTGFWDFRLELTGEKVETIAIAGTSDGMTEKIERSLEVILRNWPKLYVRLVLVFDNDENSFCLSQGQQAIARIAQRITSHGRLGLAYPITSSKYIVDSELSESALKRK